MYDSPNSIAQETAFAFAHYQSDSLSTAGAQVSIQDLCSTEGLLRKSNHTARDPRHSVEALPLQNPRETSSRTRDVHQSSPARAPHHTHMRSRSATTASPSPSFIISDHHRTRSASISGSTRGTKSSYTYPMTLPRGIFPRVKPVLSIATEIEETIGSFSPTSCPRQHLHDILETFVPPQRRRSSLRVVTTIARSGKSDSRESSPSSSLSPPLSPIPSICRTPSSYSESEYFPTAPSSAGPATPVHSAVSSPLVQTKVLRPILEALEDSSKFRVQTACASCGKFGSNYPCCPRCGEMWCSRACRLKSTGGKRHTCAKKT
ncbi:hypothetical protein NM688_g5205 [Phlebia brevispora]|uniref:Uncharacterized protein n=1 Tax=Phlebia brevispora TaxID=194682 RepID=A0ACC1SYZ5_9APHY|nr:hypothetical protein NM688_g5205 [Phlebia brevispora]